MISKLNFSSNVGWNQKRSYNNKSLIINNDRIIMDINVYIDIDNAIVDTTQYNDI